jgi:hypothetical protein
MVCIRGKVGTSVFNHVFGHGCVSGADRSGWGLLAVVVKWIGLRENNKTLAQVSSVPSSMLVSAP